MGRNRDARCMTMKKNKILTYSKAKYTKRDIMLIRSKMEIPRAWIYRESQKSYQLIFKPNLKGIFL
jgi:hypothetical protein